MSCFKRNLISVCTLTQSSGGTSCGLTNIKWNWNMSRSDWKCSPVHKYRLSQSKWTFFTEITEGARYVYPRVGEWVTRRDVGDTQIMFRYKVSWNENKITQSCSCFATLFHPLLLSPSCGGLDNGDGGDGCDDGDDVDHELVDCWMYGGLWKLSI